VSDSRGQSARELAEAVRHGTLSSLTLIETALERIEATAELNAFITVVEDSARERARQADQAAERSPRRVRLEQWLSKSLLRQPLRPTT